MALTENSDHDLTKPVTFEETVAKIADVITENLPADTSTPQATEAPVPTKSE